MRNLLVCCALMSIFYACEGWAQELEPAESANNTVEFFVGGTHSDDNDTELSLGVSYQRRLRENFGIGGLAEYTKSGEWVLAAPLTFYPTESWRVFLAPGVELEDSESEFLVRVGTAYEIEMEGWTLSPELSFDFVDGEVKVVLGLDFGFEF